METSSTNRSWPDKVLDAELSCLVLWPPGTVGEREETELIRLLNRLAAQHGYGRVSQLMRAIEDIWYNRDRVAHYEQVKEDHLEFMEKCRKAVKP